MIVEFAEWTPDRPDLTGNMRDALNVVPNAGNYQSLNSVNPFTQALPSRVYAAIATGLNGGQSTIHAATADTLYQLQGETWTDVSKAGGYSTAEGWQFVQADSFILAFSKANIAQQRSIGGGPDFADVTDAPKAGTAGIVRQFVVAGDIDDPSDGDIPNRVRWSAINNPVSWPLAGLDAAAAVQSDQQDLPSEDGRIQAIVGTEYGVVLQERSISRMTYAGAPLVFQFDRIDSTRGALARGGVASVGRRIFFLSKDGFYVNDGAGESQSIGHAKVDDYFFSRLDRDYLDRIRASVDPIRKLIYWAYPAIGTDGNPQDLLIYNYVENRWSRAEVDASGFIEARLPGVTLEDLDVYGSIENVPENLDSRVWQPGLEFFGVITSDFRIATLDGEALSATLETGEVALFDRKRAFVSNIRPLIDTFGSVSVRVGSRELQGNNVHWGPLTTRQLETGDCNVRDTGFFHRARFFLDGGFKDAYGFDVEAIPESGR